MISKNSAKDAIETLENLGLRFISTHTQIKNGTYAFEDSYDGSLYGMFLPSGYVRKMGEKSIFGVKRWYQLNPTHIQKHQYGTSKSRILLPNDIDKMLEIIIRVVKKSRK